MLASASILIIGSEVLSGEEDDINSRIAIKILEDIGVSVTRIDIIPDDEDEIKNYITSFQDKIDLVIISGGLGLTSDDVTKKAIIDLLGGDVKYHEEALKKIRKKFSDPHYLKFAMYPEKATMVVENPIGYAVGFVFKLSKTTYIVLPGVPSEFKAMLTNLKPIIPKFLEISTHIIPKLKVNIWGLKELVVEEMMQDKIPSLPPYTIKSDCNGVHIIFRNLPEGKINELKNQLLEVFKNHIYSLGNISLHDIVVEKLISKGLSISTIESCTGGLIAKTFTDRSGSSKYFMGSIVSYANYVKEKIGVNSKTLEDYGAVSKETAIEMAESGYNFFKTDIVISTTGIAGPTGGTPLKPVGLVYVGVRLPSGKIIVSENHFVGDRHSIRIQAMNEAFNIIRINL